MHLLADVSFRVRSHVKQQNGSAAGKVQIFECQRFDRRVASSAEVDLSTINFINDAPLSDFAMHVFQGVKNIRDRIARLELLYAMRGTDKSRSGTGVGRDPLCLIQILN